jgi:hypothetical protein
MKKTKAIVDFSGYTGADLDPVVQTIHDQMTANVATFATPPVAMTALQTQIDTYRAKLAARANRGKDDILAFNTARHDIEMMLADLGNYVNTVAQGDEVIVAQSGFPSYGGDVAPPNQIPAAPADLKLRHGDLSTTVVARYKPDRQHSMNEVQKNIGDPNHEADWHEAGIFGGGRALLTGLTVGTTLWVRVRTRLPNNTSGPWSDPAKITVI